MDAVPWVASVGSVANTTGNTVVLSCCGFYTSAFVHNKENFLVLKINPIGTVGCTSGSTLKLPLLLFLLG